MTTTMKPPTTAADELAAFANELCEASAALAAVARRRRVITIALTRMKEELGRVRGRLFHEVGAAAEATAQEATDLHSQTRAAESLFATAAQCERTCNDVRRNCDDLFLKKGVYGHAYGDS